MGYKIVEQVHRKMISVAGIGTTFYFHNLGYDYIVCNFLKVEPGIYILGIPPPLDLSGSETINPFFKILTVESPRTWHNL